MDSDPFELIMARLEPPAPTAESLFLPLVPLRKFPPPDSVTFPRDILTFLVGNAALESIFPFNLKQQQQGSAFLTKQDFHEYICSMSDDRELVIKRPLRIVLNE